MANVLVVDDETGSCEALAEVLRRAGHDVACAPNGREALSALIARTPDVVVLDMAMPVMDGVSFLEVVRSYLRLQHLPVIVLSAEADQGVLGRAKSLGAGPVFRKGDPYLKDLLLAIDSAARRGP